MFAAHIRNCAQRCSRQGPRRTLSSQAFKDVTYFGFQKVDKVEKKPLVASVFHRVANKYDLMNDLMSGGIHRYWKDEFVNLLKPISPIRILDVAGGTGDIAFRVARYLASSQQSPPSHEHRSITVSDINFSMLNVGKERASRMFADTSIFKWVEADAEELKPFQDSEFDAYTIAFGMRNVTDVSKALHEAYRVLRPGGRFLCLEFSHVDNALLRSLYDAYSFNVIPSIGQAVAQDRDSYKYLVESIRQFPKQNEFAGLIEEAGFQRVQYTDYMGGIAAIHSGYKL